jgi:hypothetical protein
MENLWTTRRGSRLQLALRLQPSQPPEDDHQDEALERLGLMPNLLLLARIDHQHEYDQCYSAAWHLLGRRPRRSGRTR